jgi:hypothetical protein
MARPNVFFFFFSFFLRFHFIIIIVATCARRVCVWWCNALAPWPPSFARSLVLSPSFALRCVCMCVSYRMSHIYIHTRKHKATWNDVIRLHHHHLLSLRIATQRPRLLTLLFRLFICLTTKSTWWCNSMLTQVERSIAHIAGKEEFVVAGRDIYLIIPLWLMEAVIDFIRDQKIPAKKKPDNCRLLQHFPCCFF